MHGGFSRVHMSRYFFSRAALQGLDHTKASGSNICVKTVTHEVKGMKMRYGQVHKKGFLRKGEGYVRVVRISSSFTVV